MTKQSLDETEPRSVARERVRDGGGIAWKRLAATLVLAACSAHTRTPDTFVRMQRSGCLGWCQVYTLTLYADGAVQYRGYANVPEGTRWATVAPDEVARLMEAAERVPGWHCDANRFTYDVPGGATIMVSRHGRVTQHIEPEPGDPCTPDAARELEVHIDIVSHSWSVIDR